MITFIDLAGHHKYLKTTIFGLTSYCPDFAMLVVSANTGIGECCPACTDTAHTAICEEEWRMGGMGPCQLLVVVRKVY